MRNYVQAGDTVTVVAPAGGVAGGAGVVIGQLFGVAAFAAAEGKDVEIATRGVFDLVKASGAIAAGAAVYWDVTPGRITTVAADGVLVGVAIAPAGESASTARVRLNGVYGAAAAATLAAEVAAIDARLDALEA